MSRKRFITAEDLYNFNLISSCRISPDSHHIVYCVHRVDKKTEKKYSDIWVVPTSGGEPQQFTYGDHADSQPKWSPSGAEIAFISNRDDEKQPQIYIMSFHGGEARKLTDFKGEIENFEWSPDSSKLLVSFRKKDAEEIEREKDSQKKELGVVSRHITRVFFKLDGKGYLPQERLHLWIVPLQGECLQLTGSDIYDEQTPAWSPDGKKIVFCSNHAEDPDLDLDAIDLFVIPSTGGDLFKIETPVGFKWNPQYSPDGKWVAYFGYEGRGQYWKNISLWVVPEDGSGKAQNLTEKFDLHVSTDTINDLPGALPMMPPTWSQDSKKIYVQVSRHGNTKIMSVSLDGVVEPVIDNEGVIGSFTFDREQSKLSCLYAHMKDPGEVFVHDMATNTGQKLSHVNEELLQSLDLGEVEEVWFKGADNNDLQGWIIKPPDFDKSRKYPSILEIHGGPYAQYGNFFMHEFFFLAANGYVVYFCNPRGGQGYGETHSKAIWNNWGTVDYEDLMAWTDFVEKTGLIDAKKMGVTGGSYGGFMTNWIIGHTNRFKAAVTQRSVSNMVSMYGTSDYNWPLQYEVGDEPPWENHENYWRQSPLKYIKNCQTPTLVIHSEQDMRADVEQGLQMFVALKRLGIDTELVLFPDEPHGLSREGRTDRRVARLTYIKNWFDRYLK